MTVGAWVTIGVVGFGYFIGIIGIYINTKIQLKELEMRIQQLESEHREHERINELTFNKIESDINGKINAIFTKIDEMYKYLLENK